MTDIDSSLKSIMQMVHGDDDRTHGLLRKSLQNKTEKSWRAASIAHYEASIRDAWLTTIDDILGALISSQGISEARAMVVRALAAKSADKPRNEFSRLIDAGFDARTATQTAMALAAPFVAKILTSG